MTKSRWTPAFVSNTAPVLSQMGGRQAVLPPDALFTWGFPGREWGWLPREKYLPTSGGGSKVIVRVGKRAQTLPTNSALDQEVPFPPGCLQ